ncbi:ribosomal protein S12 methylthiotransferase Rim [Candidatus Photodesmus blepharus]|uniref:Ribosomal protein S12 methylthiotransferase Rim n=1 Tax=Candidatus Photodesmus blepharonis TaxID=1179155 RepID=A0A084CME7_9GAMM|nr:LPP20 family lipoprotein [Candidatus Photodesmus blepharus]KEY90976.1 ribosomal protein S12 methylthiotransferase Rim [Candidatus Photodesmus blepharus]
MNKWIVFFVVSTLVSCQPLSNIRRDDWFVAVGYANISEQNGKNYAEKQVRAMRASKIDAYRELAEQIYGVRVSGSISLEDQSLGIEVTAGNVDGVVKGAEVARSYKVGDTYVTELRLDTRRMSKLRNYRAPQKVPSNAENKTFF